MTGGAVPGDEPAAPLPEPVRLRVVELAAQRLGTLEAAAVPASLRAIARFTPARRARLGAAPIAAAVEADEAFRAAVVDSLREAFPELVEALAAGSAPPAAPPEDVAAVAYLVRAPGWREAVDRAAVAAERQAAGRQDAEREQALTRLREQLDAARAEGRQELERLRAGLAAARDDAAALRRELREARADARRAEEARAEAERTAEERGRAADAARTAAEAEGRRAAARAVEAEAAAEAARRAVREGRSADDARLWLLVDTLAQAVRGLQQELALAPPASLPGDAVAAAADAGAGDPFARLPVRGLAPDDPAVVDQLLALPRVHVVVDGYNVTKTAYPTLSLEAQRARLLSGLGALAARTGAEVTCVFDGAERPGPVGPPAPRGLRVLFSAPGEPADDVIRRLVRAEPTGRPVVVVSSDREVADAVRRAGARPLASAAFARRLERG